MQCSQKDIIDLYLQILKTQKLSSLQNLSLEFFFLNMVKISR